MRGVRVLPFLAAIAAATLTFPLRTVRWQYLLRFEGSTLPLVPLWHATAIGFMATNLLPARAGEFARAYAVRHLTGVRFTSAFASIAVERIMDTGTLVAFLAIATWTGGFASDTSVGVATLGQLARGAGMFFTLLLVMSILVVHWPAPTLRITRTLAHKILAESWAARIVDAVEGLLAGLDSLRSPGRLAAVAFWSLAVWLTGAASFWFGFVAFGIEVPWSAAFMLQSILAFGVALQFSPGFFGQYEAITRVTLGLYGLGLGKAVSFAVGFHLGGFIPITLLGLWSLSRAQIKIRELSTMGSTEDSGG